MSNESRCKPATGFNFNTWIIQNDLIEVKDLFIKHNVTTTSTLQLTSSEFQSLMTDPLLFTNTKQIPKIMNAMQTMSFSIYRNRTYFKLHVKYSNYFVTSILFPT